MLGLLIWMPWFQSRLVTQHKTLRRRRQSVNQNWMIWFRGSKSHPARLYMTGYAISGWAERRKPPRAFQPPEIHVDNSSFWRLHRNFSLHSKKQGQNCHSLKGIRGSEGQNEALHIFHERSGSFWNLFHWDMMLINLFVFGGSLSTSQIKYSPQLIIISS